MENALSKEEKMLASSSWRRANAHNSREEQNLQKEKLRLLKQFEAETCQLKAAQNRFEQQYKSGRKTSLVLPPVHEEVSGRLQQSKRSGERRGSIGSSTSLPSLPRLADSLSTRASYDTRIRSISVGSVDSRTDVAEQTAIKPRRRTKSYAGLSTTTSMSSDQFKQR